MPTASAELPLDSIRLPERFSIELYARVPDARSMPRSLSGTVYVGNWGGDSVYAVVDAKADRIVKIASGLSMPNGVAFRGGALYVAEISRVLRYDGIDAKLDDPPEPVVVDDYSRDRHYGWKYIAFGPDGWLFVPVGAPCNICDPENPIYASITRVLPDGTGSEIWAEGIPNTVGFTWHPQTGNLWFTDYGRDNLGNDVTPDELDGNRATSYEVFAEGWLPGTSEREVWGRPVDLLVLPDGSMIVSDDKAGAIYRITYGGGS